MNCLTLLAHCHRTGTLIRVSSNALDSNATATANATHRDRVQNLMELSLYDRSPVRTVITPEALQEQLETSVYMYYDLHKGNRKCCPITQAEFVDGDAVLTLPCGHTFMQDAIQTWLEKERAECPVCRHALPSHETIP